MIDPLMDVTTYAMSALQRRAEAIADNVANANTPGYRAKRVEFEPKLAKALTDRQSIDTPAERADVMPNMSLTDAVDNTVRLEGEMADMMKTATMRQMMLSGFNFKASQVRTAVVGIR